MNQENSAADAISCRFAEEQLYIKKYIEILRRKVFLYADDVHRLVTLLQKHDLVGDTPNVRSFTASEIYPNDELKELVRQIHAAQPSLLIHLECASNKLSQLIEPADLRATDARSEAGETIEYLLDTLENGDASEVIDAVRLELRKQLRSYADGDGLVFIGNRKGTIDELIDFAVDSALYVRQSRLVAELRRIKAMIEDVDVLSRMSDGSTEIDVYRQSFIMLMTVFDATVFDLVKVALRQRFFQLIGAFSKQDKVALDRLGAYSSFEEFRDDIIEQQLKTKYLKDILALLNGQGIRLANEEIGDKYVHLVELVLRRNVHIHNRGRVDHRYLELGENGSPKYNIYSLSLGQNAIIDVAYWEHANSLCCNCVSAIADWIKVATDGPE